MIIIVEGIDRVGKTTLCNALSDELNIPIYKHPQKIMDYCAMDNINETDKMLQLIDVCNITNANIIFDRFHFSDYTYGILERGYDYIMTRKNLELIDIALKKANALLILMQPTDINMSSREHGKDLMPYSILMQDVYTLSTVNKMTCNYHGIQNTIQMIKEKYNGII